jgi:transcription-repair coupling factor (superfamily II helicase)
MLSPSPSESHSPLDPPLPRRPGERRLWGRLHGAGTALAVAGAAERHPGLVLLVVDAVQTAATQRAELGFFLAGSERPILDFPDWETLPYDVFSPLPELVSERLLTLHRLPTLEHGVLIVPVATLMQRLPPRDYVDGHSLVLAVGDRLDLDATRRRLERAGYSCVSQVIGHGEYAVRGSLLDIFPMGSQVPLRIDLFDAEVESIRVFDPETQRSRDKLDRIRLLPARELPLDEEAIAGFRQRYRAAIAGDPQRSLIYREVSKGQAPGGLEYYLPLFFEQTATLFDYLPEDTLVVESIECRETARIFFENVEQRYEQRRHDGERPLLPPSQLYLTPEELAGRLNRLSGVLHQPDAVDERRKGYADACNFATHPLPPLTIQARAAHPAQALHGFLAGGERRVLFVAESSGRRELLAEQLKGFAIQARPVSGWRAFLDGDDALALTVAPIEQGLLLEDAKLAVITESQLYGERVRQERRRRERERDSDAIVRNLTELTEGAPVVHEEHGVGRYLGLQTLEVGGLTTEFLTLEYANGDKLYVPVSALQLISRYTGASPENAPLHRLGGDQWERIKHRAAQKAHDVAAELLDIHARRAARQGVAFPEGGEDYAAFAAAFPFEETPDQQRAIESVLADMADPKPMDRVVCGDVGFGKTEVAMRAAFMAVHGGRQVVVLVPTTLLAQQHFENFSDRFADWPVRVESLSRFRTAKEQKAVLDGLAEGTVDIVVGTHKLLQPTIRFKNLGLAIIDEEHRFGVRHKEAVQGSAQRGRCPDADRHADSAHAQHGHVRPARYVDHRHPAGRPPSDQDLRQSLERCAWSRKPCCANQTWRSGVLPAQRSRDHGENGPEARSELIPEARVAVAHGQMRERELERIMRDFYHQRFNLLVCTTIIESGIDVPSANTIVINRADKLGLAQLHQLRGRVGRSHHRAYAYLITPPTKVMTADAKKRLEAIESMEDLGAGFTLATHDLEIRGAGELLGDEQSGQITEVGFTLYMELLERAVKALKSGRAPELDRPLDHGTEIDLGIPALLPSDYLPDVQARLVLYKRIAGARNREELRELQVEMIDRFGLLPEPAKNLLEITELKLLVQPWGIRKIEAGPASGRLLFTESPRIDPARLIGLIQSQPKEYKLEGGDKLKFFRDMAEPGARIREVRRVLEPLLA